MGRTSTGLTKSLEATVAIPKRRLVRFGAADGAGVLAVNATTYIRGVSADIDTDIGERVSVFMSGNVADVEYGGTVARGDALTADAQGRAITTTTAGNFIVGYAEVSGVVGDIGSVDVLPGKI